MITLREPTTREIIDWMPMMEDAKESEVAATSALSHLIAKIAITENGERAFQSVEDVLDLPFSETGRLIQLAQEKLEAPTKDDVAKNSPRVAFG